MDIEYIKYNKRLLVLLLIDSNKYLMREFNELKCIQRLKIISKLNMRAEDFKPEIMKIPEQKGRVLKVILINM